MSVSLTFRGFEVDPCTIEEVLGVAASESGRRGFPVKVGVKAVLKRSFARFSIDSEGGARLDQMVPSIISHLGGVAPIGEARRRAEAEILEINITLPVKHSDEQEGGFISVESVNDLSRLGCSLTFSFV
ncbi:MAG: hypothetical protein JHC82_01705 [Stenotrophomonas sp.]|nr:hypothetical protein [Stenotrophomonas sp.]